MRLSARSSRAPAAALRFSVNAAATDQWPLFCPKSRGDKPRRCAVSSVRIGLSNPFARWKARTALRVAAVRLPGYRAIKVVADLQGALQTGDKPSCNRLGAGHAKSRFLDHTVDRIPYHWSNTVPSRPGWGWRAAQGWRFRPVRASRPHPGRSPIRAGQAASARIAPICSALNRVCRELCFIFTNLPFDSGTIWARSRRFSVFSGGKHAGQIARRDICR